MLKLPIKIKKAVRMEKVKQRFLLRNNLGSDVPV